MAQIKELAKFDVPLGGQHIELQHIDHVEGGMGLSARAHSRRQAIHHL